MRSNSSSSNVDSLTRGSIGNPAVRPSNLLLAPGHRDGGGRAERSLTAGGDGGAGGRLLDMATGRVSGGTQAALRLRACQKNTTVQLARRHRRCTGGTERGSLS